MQWKIPQPSIQYFPLAISLRLYNGYTGVIFLYPNESFEATDILRPSRHPPERSPRRE